MSKATKLRHKKLAKMETLTIKINGTETSFNENETTVLKALYNQSVDSTGGEFGNCLDARKTTGMSKNVFAGYMSALQQKNVFDYIDTDYSTPYGGQFTFQIDVRDSLIALVVYGDIKKAI